jgi:hypothetical protein
MSAPIPTEPYFGHTLHLICGPDATYDILLMRTFFRDGRWWLSGYDNCDIGEPMVLAADDVTAWELVD